MPHPWAGLLPQMPHPGEDKVVKCPTNARRGMRAVGIDGAIILASSVDLEIGVGVRLREV